MKEISDSVSRRGLAATLSLLKGGGREGASTPATEMRRRTFAPNPGDLEMWLHVPPNLEPGSPLVVVLHGCTQTAEAFAVNSGWIELADRLGFAVLAPQQSAANNSNRCFNWFEVGDMRRSDGEPASIAAMVEDAIGAHGLDAERVFVTGLSAGGAMTAVMLAAYPDMFAGGAVIAGLPYGAARGVAQAFQAMQGQGAAAPGALAALLADAGGAALDLPPLSIWHGDADHVVRPANADDLARQWAAGQGLAPDPDEISAGAGYVRSIWRDPEGVVRIQLNRTPGLGHGVPLETRGATPLGRPGSYMLQAGVNSTLEIAQFWGLAPTQMEAFAPGQSAETRSFAAASGGVGEQVMAAVAGVSPGVQAVIEDALVRGGLLTRARGTLS